MTFKKATKEWRNEDISTRRYIIMFETLLRGNEVNLDNLEKDYHEYCEERGIRPMDNLSFRRIVKPRIR